MYEYQVIRLQFTFCHQNANMDVKCPTDVEVATVPPKVEC